MTIAAKEHCEYCGRSNTATSPENPVDCVVSLHSVRACIEEIICEAQNNPDDSLRDIANEAIENARLPLKAHNNWEYDSNYSYFVSVEESRNS